MEKTLHEIDTTAFMDARTLKTHNQHSWMRYKVYCTEEQWDRFQARTAFLGLASPYGGSAEYRRTVRNFIRRHGR